MADINIAQVTTTDPTEDGVFDVLMRSVESHLDKQYTSGRIKGADYATVYLGALQSVLQQAIAFVLAEQKTEKEIELATAQYDKTLEEIDVLQAQEAEILAGTIRQDDVAAEQITASQANTTLKQQLGDAQEALYNRQTQGFDEDYKYKVFKSLLDLRTTGMTQEMAGLVNDATSPSTPGANALANAILTDAGITGVSGIVADVI